ncbi:Phage envelope protein [Mycolicibacterium flavescens]|uniref:DUF1398 family protein n=1 Tax=Mycobacterium neumannii TaxID=2048551 RepID=UPI000F6C36A9|nr:DUF1398 family protein [Mycobacterium neumannii]VEG45931.1 Phage envelope protein [Mycolicibacterium flavescens]
MRPTVGGFPVFAEVLRQAGVRHNEWFLPSTQSLYLTDAGAVVQMDEPLVRGGAMIPRFDRSALVRAIETDQAGNCTFRQFLEEIWRGGVVRYLVDFDARTVTYFGAGGEQHCESYPLVRLAHGRGNNDASAGSRQDHEDGDDQPRDS